MRIHVFDPLRRQLELAEVEISVANICAEYWRNEATILTRKLSNANKTNRQSRADGHKVLYEAEKQYLHSLAHTLMAGVITGQLLTFVTLLIARFV